MSRYRSGDLIDDQYEVISFIDEGGFSEVYRVRNQVDEMEYALKIYFQGNVRDVNRELRPLRRVQHPNVLNAHWGGRLLNGKWFIALDYVTGQSLRSRLEKCRRLDACEVHEIGTQLLDALHAIHPSEARLAELRDLDERTLEEHEEWRELQETGIVHRDVKPENILLSENGTLVLCDFGISSRSGTQRLTRSYTPHYTPPDLERLSVGPWDADVDRYAAGVTFVETLCETHPDVVADLRAELETNPSVPQGLIEFLEVACAPDREDRFDSTASMIDAWNEIDWEDDSDFVPAVPRNEPNASELSDQEIRELLLGLVKAHGPIKCRELYRLFASATKSNPTRRLNQLVYAMVSSSNYPLEQIEPLGGGQQDKTVFIEDY